MSVAEAGIWVALFVGMALGYAKRKSPRIDAALSPLEQAPLSPEEMAEHQASMQMVMQKHFEAQQRAQYNNPAQHYLDQLAGGLGGPLIPPR